MNTPARRLVLKELEIELQRQLHHARITRQGRDSADGTAVNVSLGQTELRGIGQIEHFPAKLQVATFTEVGKRAGQGEIEVRDAWTTQRVAPAIAESRRQGTRGGIQRAGCAIGRGVEPSINGALVFR